MNRVEEILNSPDRVHCAPYRANLSREACLKQQELARQERHRWWGFVGVMGSRVPCLTCSLGRTIRKGGKAGRPVGRKGKANG